MSKIARTLCGLAVALAATAAAPALAASPSGQYALKGVGQHTCAQFLAAREQGSSQYVAYGAWLAGYLTAVNKHVAGVVDVAPWQTLDLVAAYVANLCASSGDALLARAVEVTVEALLPGSVEGDVEQLTVSAGDRETRIYDQVLKRAQERLSEAGFHDGKADGAFGPQTEKSFRDFQKANGIDETGLPDLKTLYVLFRSSAGKN